MAAWRTIVQQPPGQDVTLLVAAQSHRAWVEKVLWYVDHPHEEWLITADASSCSFGRWFEGSGVARYGKFAEYKAAGNLHEQTLKIAVQALELARSGQREVAEKCLQELMGSRDRLLHLLGLLMKRNGGLREATAKLERKPSGVSRT
jgi:hypothetical protein